MANLYYARKIEEIYFEAKRNQERCMCLADDINIPILKPLDTDSTRKDDNNSAQESFELNQPIISNSTEEIEIQKPDLNTKANSIQIANTVLNEAHKLWKRKNIIRNKINEINSINAFNFAGYMITASDTGTVLGDIYKYITCTEIKHLSFALLKQAKNSGLVNIAQYSNLKNVYNLVNKIWNTNPYKKLNRSTIHTINTALEEMYEELFKIY